MTRTTRKGMIAIILTALAALCVGVTFLLLPGSPWQHWTAAIGLIVTGTAAATALFWKKESAAGIAVITPDDVITTPEVQAAAAAVGPEKMQEARELIEAAYENCDTCIVGMNFGDPVSVRETLTHVIEQATEAKRLLEIPDPGPMN